MTHRPEKTPVRITGDDAAEPAVAALLRREVAATREVPPGARARIWRSLEATAPARRRSLASRVAIPALGLALAATVAVLLGVPDLLRAAAATPSPAMVVLASPSARGQSPGSPPSGLSAGAQLDPQTEVWTEVRDSLGVRLADVGVLFGERTRATLHAPGAGAEIDLSIGRAVISAGRPPERMVTLSAAGFTVESATALFEVRVAADQTLSVLVDEGSVRVRGRSADASVGPKESWSSRDGPEHLMMDAADATTARWLASANEGWAPMRVEIPVDAEIELDGVKLGRAPLKLLAPLGPHSFAAVHEGRRSEVRALVGHGVPVLALTPPPPAEPGSAAEPDELELRTRLAASDGSPAEHESLGYQLARLLAARGKANEALPLFEDLAAADGPRAEAALYEVGRLRLRHLADPTGALRAFADYRHRFPDGALVQEVALSCIEARLAASSQLEALRDIDTFLKDYPESERRDDLRLLRANLRRERGDCQAALGDYLALLDDSRRGDDALFFAAICEQKSGHFGAAREHLSAYLERFPAGAHRVEAEGALNRR